MQSNTLTNTLYQLIAANSHVWCKQFIGTAAITSHSPAERPLQSALLIINLDLTTTSISHRVSYHANFKKGKPFPGHLSESPQSRHIMRPRSITLRVLTPGRITLKRLLIALPRRETADVISTMQQLRCKTAAFRCSRGRVKVVTTSMQEVSVTDKFAILPRYANFQFMYWGCIL